MPDRPKRGAGGPSLLDRFPDPQAVAGTSRGGLSTDKILATVRRDIENLLNSRQRSAELPGDFTELRRSIANYGFPDVVGLRTSTPAEREAICRLIELRLADYEPRLTDVHVSHVETDKEEIGSFRFQIDAVLRTGASASVAFASTLELATGHTTVQTSQA